MCCFCCSSLMTSANGQPYYLLSQACCYGGHIGDNSYRYRAPISKWQAHKIDLQTPQLFLEGLIPREKINYKEFCAFKPFSSTANRRYNICTVQLLASHRGRYSITGPMKFPPCPDSMKVWPWDGGAWHDRDIFKFFLLSAPCIPGRTWSLYAWQNAYLQKISIAWSEMM